MTSLVAVIPAAGVGKRMGADRPKQYLPLLNASVLEHTLRQIDRLPFVSDIVISISEGDPYWPELSLSLDHPLHCVSGGAERVDSVFNAVDHVKQHGLGDWVLVHDAARPCVRIKDIQNLVDSVADHPCGGILGAPVRDTMKQVAENNGITGTVDRSVLWHAFTPQLFRTELLHQALLQGLKRPDSITDESSALEALGYEPMMVAGSSDNLKITRPEDLPLAEFYLSTREV